MILNMDMDMDMDIEDHLWHSSGFGQFWQTPLYPVHLDPDGQCPSTSHLLETEKGILLPSWDSWTLSAVIAETRAARITNFISLIKILHKKTNTTINSK